MQTSTTLKKSLSWLQGSAITIGSVIGAGILVLPALTAQIAGPGALLSWFFMGILSLPMISIIGIMSAKYPNAGGISTYAGKGINSYCGQLSSLFFVGAMPFGMPITSLIDTTYLGAFLGWSSGMNHLAAAILITLAILFNYRGIKFSGMTQLIFVLFILFILLFAIYTSLPHIHRTAFTPFFLHGFIPVLKSISLIFFAFTGWEIISNLAEEFKNPQRDIPLSLGISAIVINFLYIAIIIAIIGSEVYLKTSPFTAMLTLISFGSGNLAAGVIGILGCLACYCPVHTFFAGFSRVIYAQAREHHLPAIFAQLHPRFQTPANALLSFLPICYLMLFLSYFFSWNLQMFISISCTNFLMVYTLGLLGAARMLKNYKFKFLAYLSCIITGILFLFMGWYILYPLLITIIFSIKYSHFLVPKRI